MWTKEKSTILTQILVKALIGFMIIGLFVIPLCTQWYDLVSNKAPVIIPLTITLYCAMVPGFVLMFALNKLLANIRKKEVFTESNIKMLRISSWCCFIAAALFFGFGFFRILSFLICFAGVFLGLVIRVVKNIFEQALELREENDYTI